MFRVPPSKVNPCPDDHRFYPFENFVSGGSTGTGVVTVEKQYAIRCLADEPNMRSIFSATRVGASDRMKTRRDCSSLSQYSDMASIRLPPFGIDTSMCAPRRRAHPNCSSSLLCRLINFRMFMCQNATVTIESDYVSFDSRISCIMLIVRASSTEIYFASVDEK